MTITEQLKQKYDTLINQNDPQSFARGLSAYLDYALNRPELKAIFDMQMDESMKLVSEIEELEKLAQGELNGADTNLRKLITKTGIRVESFERFITQPWSTSIKTTLLQELDAIKIGQSSNIFPSDDITRYLFDIAANLYKEGHEAELRETGCLSDNNDDWRHIVFSIPPTHNQLLVRLDGNLVFSKTLPQRRECVTVFDLDRKKRSWGQFEILLQFKLAYDASSTNIRPQDFPERGTKSRPWFYAPKERVDMASMSKTINSSINKLNISQLKISANAVHLQLLGSAEDEVMENDLKATSEIIFSSPNALLLYKSGSTKESRHLFHKGDAQKKMRLKLFIELWNNKRIFRNGTQIRSGEELAMSSYAVKIGLLQNRGNFTRDPSKEERLKTFIKGLNRMFREKDFPMKIEGVGSPILTITYSR